MLFCYKDSVRSGPLTLTATMIGKNGKHQVSIMLGKLLKGMALVVVHDERMEHYVKSLNSAGSRSPVLGTNQARAARQQQKHARQHNDLFSEAFPR